MKCLGEDRVLSARKEYRCNWCNEAIAVGEAYMRQRNVDGSEAWVWRAHAECSAAACRFSNDDLENCSHVQFSRGCSCEAGQHDADATWPCDETPLTQEAVASMWRKARVAATLEAKP